MTLLTLINRNIAQRKLSAILTALSVALGVMIVSSILKARDELASTYKRQADGYSLVVGPAGSPLELVLNSIYHTGQSAGLVPYSIYSEFASPKWERFMRLAVPYAVGDSFKGYRVVATTDQVFSPEFPFPKAQKTEDKFASGGPFHFDPKELAEAIEHLKAAKGIQVTTAPAHEEHDDHDHDDHDAHGDEHHHHDEHGRREAVLGYEVAQARSLSVGQKINPAHGVETSGKAHDHGDWTITGILKRTGTPLDRVVFTNLESFFGITEHSGGLIPGTNEPGLSAVLLFPVEAHKPGVLIQLKKRSDLTVAEVATEIRRLLEIVGNVDRLFFWVAVMVVVIGVTSILVAIYNTMNERRRDVAILRAIGAHKSVIFVTIVGEAAFLAFAGAAAGLGLTRVLLFFVGEKIAQSAGIRIDPYGILPEEILVVVLVTITGAIAGMIPAVKAYTTDVAKYLSPIS